MADDPLETSEKEKERYKKLKRSKSTLNYSEKSEQLKSQLEQSLDESELILKELRKAASDGKNRHTKEIQKLEIELCNALCLSMESWIPEDKSLNDVVKIIEERQEIALQMLAGSLLDDKSLLKKISNGQALCGVLLNKTPEDLLKNRRCLLETPKNVVTMAESLSDTKTIQFSSPHEEKSYKSIIDNFGHSAAYITASLSHKSQEKAKPNKKAYTSIVKHSTVQVASYSFENKDLRLSGEAINELHKIFKALKRNKNVKSECEALFVKYGSHVYTGPLSFGGNVWWTCSCEGFEDENMPMVKKIQEEIISATAGCSFAGFGISTDVIIDQIKDRYKEKCPMSILDNIHLKVRITGGPSKVTDLNLWKTGLIASNNMWILTDRGGNLMPLWDIIRVNYEKDFGELKEVLRSTWERMSGLKAEQDTSASLNYNCKEVLAKVNKWKEDETLTSQQYETHLCYLLRVKEDIFDNTGNGDLWLSNYLSNQNLQEFLESVVDSNIESVKPIMKQVVELEELKQFNIDTFPRIEHVSEWLYSFHQTLKLSTTQHFHNFIKFLGKTLQSIQLHNSKLPSDEIAADVSKEIHYLQKQCQDTYDEILITILVYPFLDQGVNYGSVTKLHAISSEHLEFLYDQFSMKRAEFDQYLMENQPLHYQAYLFKVALDISGDTDNNKQLLWQITQMMRALQPPLQQEIEDCLSNSLPELRESFQNLMTKTIDQQPTLTGSDHIPHSLRNILTIAAHKSEKPPCESSLLIANLNAHKLFEKLGATELYLNKLQLRDALCIRQGPLKISLNETKTDNPKQLIYLVLHKVMVYDVSCRSDLMFSSSDGSDNEYEDYECADNIHPIDALLTLFFCSDDFLRQDLLSRLAKCQLSVPFILPDPFTKQLTIPLWSLSCIIKDWKSTKVSGNVEPQTHPIINYPMPIVSFIGIGKRKDGKSKSRILNQVISESHDHFFHRDLPGGQYSCLLGEGLVDMCWYLPDGKPADTFPDAVTFLNLHGDARKHPQQSRFLSQISSMCFVLLSEEVQESDGDTIETLKMFTLCPGGITLLDNVGKKPGKVLQEILCKSKPINLKKK